MLQVQENNKFLTKHLKTCFTLNMHAEIIMEYPGINFFWSVCIAGTAHHGKIETGMIVNVKWQGKGIMSS